MTDGFTPVYPQLEPTTRRAQVYRQVINTLRLARVPMESPVPAQQEEPPRPRPVDGSGICLSGGGIRAASYALGALQVLEENDLLRRAKYLSAVSGGSYMATALTMVALGHKDHRDAAIDLDWQPARPGRADGRPFFPGTPEERYLRNRTLYLTHGPGGVPGVVWRVLIGILLNVTIIAALLNAVSRPIGWLYGSEIRALRAGCGRRFTCTHYAIPSWAILAVLGIAGVSALVGFVWLAWSFRRETTRGLYGAASGALFALALVLAVLLIGLPELLYWMALVFHPRAGVGSTPVVTATTAKSTAGVGLGALLVSALAVVRRLTSSPGDAEKAAEAVLKPYKKAIINILIFLAGPVLTVSGAVLLIHWAAADPPGTSGAGIAKELLLWAVPTGLLGVFWLRADLVAWSLHGFYKMRLSAAFVLCRIRSRRNSPTAVEGEDAAARPYPCRQALSECQPPAPYPEVLICASVNVSKYGMTPTQSHVSSFVFSAKEIGGPLVGGMPTDDYEAALDDYSAHPVSLPMAMAISSAAFAPSMGRMTRAQWRYLMAVANLRLGVWVPNPRRVTDSLVKRLRKVYPLRPRPHYLIREMLGLNDIDAPFLYVTDGGHYDNLGLVELIRRRCRWIWCIDASGDRIDTFSTLGGAIEHAKAELQVEVEIDPTEMAPGPACETDPGGPRSRFVRRTYCRGTIRYPDTDATSTLIVVKAGVPIDAPWDVRAFHAANERFPCDPTLDQLFSADRFDAYRALAAFSMGQAIDEYKTQFHTTIP